jgi:hypothetical protein
MILLTSKLPTVRKAAAEHLYTSSVRIEALRGKPHGVWGQGTLQVLQEVLCCTSWEGGDLANIKKARSQIINLLHLSSPKQTAAQTRSKVTLATQSSSSYQSLVNDFARGI